MYLHLGSGTIVTKKSVIGIFDLDNASYSRLTKDFLKKAETAKLVEDISGELPRVFALCEKKGKTKVYLSQLSSQTLQKRWEAGEVFE